MLAIQMVIILYFAEPTCILQKMTKTLTREWTMSINIPGLILCKQMQLLYLYACLSLIGSCPHNDPLLTFE